ncbi:bidirectional sugar transporter SWEET7-like [Hibiscus syriacus]|uniref:Bidirectional sugar transporter SWEET7-like n=1 Tax=Hibiscus syriacus TaxID=106335 RepID=A0A6A2XJ95_HIBSY|nr:bidirectional sugar transporter SWEET7-like [Hibiscus syriacus]
MATANKFIPSVGAADSESTSDAQQKAPVPFPIQGFSSPLRLETSTRLTNPDDSSLDNPDLGPFLLKLARDTIASGEGPTKALDYAIRAAKSFERCAVEGEPSLDLAMSLHVLAAIYCSLGRFDEAVPFWNGRFKSPIWNGVRITRWLRSQVSELIVVFNFKRRDVIEGHVQAMQFDKAEELCKKTLEIHHAHSEPASLEEAADRRLMALVCEAKGDYEVALELLVLASMAMIANGQEYEVAAIDVNIGNIYMSLCRFDEAVFSYQKALTVFKSSKGDNHPQVGSQKRAGGLTEISAIYESVDEPEEALKLLQKAMKLEDKPGQQSTIAGIEAWMGVMLYILGRYEEARKSFESAVAKLRASGERKSAFFGVVLNQMGLACVQLFKIDEAATYDAMGRVEDAIEILGYVLKLREKLGIANPDFEDEKSRLAELLKEAGHM